MTATKRPYRTLSDELTELERTDPAVKEAAEDYDRTVRKILRRHRERLYFYSGDWAHLMDWMIRSVGLTPTHREGL